MAAPTLRSVSTGGATSATAGATFTVTKPAGVASGDLLLAYQYGDESSVEAQLTGPSGWTLLGTKSDLQSAGCGILKIWQKTATGSEPASYTFGVGSGGNNTDGDCAILAFTAGTFNSATPTTTPTFGGSGTVNNNSVAPSVTGVVDGLLLCSFHALGGNATWTPPAGMTEIVDFKSSGVWTASEVASLALTSTAATGTKTATSSVGGMTDLSSSLIVNPTAASDATTPSVPTGVTANANSSAQVTVSWNASTDNVGVASYRVRRNGANLTAATAVTGTSFIDNTVSPSTSYSYTVSAVDAAGNRSAESSAAQVNTPAAEAPLAAWSTAVNGRSSAPATVCWVGDSITEGQGASTKANRWQDVLLPQLRSDYPTAGVAGGAGYLPGWYAVFSPDSTWTHTNATRTGTITDAELGQDGTSIPIPSTNDQTIGERSERMSAGATLTFTVTGTSMDLWWVQGYGTFTYRIDSGTAVSVSTAGTAGMPGRTAGINLGGGTHTVTITATSAVRFGGIYVYDGDESKGLRAYDFGHVGWDSGAYLGMGETWGLISPDLVVIELGPNDFIYSHYTSAQMKANLEQLISEIRSAVPKSVSVAVSLLNGNLNSGTNSETWTDYRNAITAVTTDDPTVALFDWGTLGPTASDGAHPNDTGHANIAATLRTLVAAAPGTGQTLATETWTGSNGAAWSAQWTLNKDAGFNPPGGGAFSIQSNAGRVVTGATVYSFPRAYLSGMSSVTDCDLTFDFTLAAIAEEYILVGLSCDNLQFGGNVWYPQNGYCVRMMPGENSWSLEVYSGNTERFGQGTSFAATGAFTFAASTTYKVRMKRTGGQIQFKIWAASGSEPSTWNGDWTDPTPLSAGKVLLSPCNGGDGVARTFTFDNLTVTDGGTGSGTTPTLKMNAGASQISKMFVGSTEVAKAYLGSTLVFDPQGLGGGSPFESTPLEAWTSALQNSNTRTATMVVIGDSLAEGQGASTRANRWVDLIQPQFRSDWPAPDVGGVGYLASFFGIYGPDSTWFYPCTYTGTTSQDPTGGGGSDLTPGRREVSMSAGAKATFSLTGTAVDIYWVNGFGSFTYAVDGGSTTSVSTASGTSGDISKTRVTLGASGSHSLVITATSTIRFAGVMVYNGDENVGIRVIDASRTGYHAYDMTGMGEAWAQIAPDLALIELGYNDEGDGRTAAQIKSDLQTIISDIRNSNTKPVSICVMVFNEMTSKATVQTIATDDPTVHILDIGALSSVANNDGIHPNDTGQVTVANMVRSDLSTALL